MGRVALGAAKKDKVIGVRVTDHEKQALEARVGNPGKWLRRLVEAELAKEAKK